MAVNPRRILRRMTGLLPRLAIGVLFLAPLAIWLMKQEEPAIEQERVPGRILEVTGLPTRETGAADRFTVRLQDGEVVVFETEAAAMPFSPGDDVVVVRTVQLDGTVNFRLERL